MSLPFLVNKPLLELLGTSANRYVFMCKGKVVDLLCEAMQQDRAAGVKVTRPELIRPRPRQILAAKVACEAIRESVRRPGPWVRRQGVREQPYGNTLLPL